MAGAMSAARESLPKWGLGIDEAGDGAGDAGGFVTNGGQAGHDVPLEVEVHVTGCGGGSLFAVIEKVGVAVASRG